MSDELQIDLAMYNVRHIALYALANKNIIANYLPARLFIQITVCTNYCVNTKIATREHVQIINFAKIKPLESLINEQQLQTMFMEFNSHLFTHTTTPKKSHSINFYDHRSFPFSIFAWDLMNINSALCTVFIDTYFLSF